jgi:hypothetical protein
MLNAEREQERKKKSKRRDKLDKGWGANDDDFGSTTEKFSKMLSKKEIKKMKKDADKARAKRMLTYARVCSRMLTYAHVCSRMLTYAGTS